MTPACLSAALKPASVDYRWFAQTLRERPVVIVGAGGLGRRVLEGLSSTGIRPALFADNNPNLWKTLIGGVDVVSPAEAAQRLRTDGIFVLSTWRPVASSGLRDLEQQLRKLDCRNVVPFPKVFWAFPETFLPYYLWDRPALLEPQAASIESALALFTDEESRNEFAAHLNFRATASLDVLPEIQSHPQYFPDFLVPFEEEHFLDCGAYNGDTIEAFLEWTQGRFQKITAFEADPRCFEELARYARAHPEIRQRLVCHLAAVTAEAGVVRFHANGTAASCIASGGEIEVPAVRLDDGLRHESPTFIKMDIEGAELDALRGAAETIRRCEPVLAICVYHAQDHLWRLPLLMSELFPSAHFFLRSYCLDGLDAICYAIPPHRLRNHS